MPVRCAGLGAGGGGMTISKVFPWPGGNHSRAGDVARESGYRADGHGGYKEQQMTDREETVVKAPWNWGSLGGGDCVS